MEPKVISLLSRASAFALLTTLSSPAIAAPKKGQEQKKVEIKDEKTGGNPFDMKSSDEPVYINSDALTLNQLKRTFVYTGHVKVTQGDMTLSSDILEGRYNEANKIEELIAKKNVVITKGPNIKATSQRAVYDALKEVVTLTENPQLHQEGSILTADAVKVYLRENRSIAEGQVRMKLIKGGGDSLDAFKK